MSFSFFSGGNLGDGASNNPISTTPSLRSRSTYHKYPHKKSPHPAVAADFRKDDANYLEN
jgi:hypothetical protein